MLDPIPLAVTLAEGGFGGTTGPDLTRYLVVVGILIAAILGCSVLLRRVIVGAHRTRATHRDLAVLDVLPLGGKRQISVVRCYDRTFALGVGERDVTLIAELDAVVHAAPKPGTELPPGDFVRLFEAARERVRGVVRRPAAREREVEEVGA